MWPGVAYKTPDGKVKTELLWGTNKFLSVQMAGHAGEDVIFAFYHIFVERYINKCLQTPFNETEIFRFYLTRGDFPEKPEDMIGDLLPKIIDAQKKDVWASYEHISGPYLVDPIYVMSQMSAGRLEAISPTVRENLVPDRAEYMRNPQDLPVLGVVSTMDEIAADQKLMQDMIFRSKTKKPFYVN
jgi:hypothetical protein